VGEQRPPGELLGETISVAIDVKNVSFD